MADRNGSTGVFTNQSGGAATYRGEVLDVSAIIRAASSGIRRITLSDSAMIAPAAANMARQRGIVIERAKPTPPAQPSIPPAPAAPAAPAATNGANGTNGVPYVAPLKPPTVLDTPTGRRNASPVLPKPLEERRPDNYPSTVFRTPRNAPTITDRPAMTPATDTGPQGPMMYSQAGSVTIPTASPSTPANGNGVQTLATGAPKVVENPATGWQTVVTHQENLVEAMLATSAPVAQPVAAPTRSRWDEDTDDSPLDPITIDLIENSLRSTRFEMDAVLFRTAMSPGIREQHDEFPLIANPDGKMVVGQFGSFIAGFLKNYTGTIEEGDVFLLNDPYSCDGAVSHLNDWLVLLPIFYESRLVGWASMFGHMTDVGGAVPGSIPIYARNIHSEGVIIKPFKLFAKGVLNEERLSLILSQCRLPVWNRSDLMGIVAACRVAEKRVREMCDRFGPRTYLRVLDALLDRNYRAIRELIQKIIPTTPQSFEDYVDDDGQGYGPYKLKCTVWREGDKAIFDWDGTDPQSPAAINFLLNTEMLKMFIGVYMIMVHDPQILFNDGYYDLLDIRIPKGSILAPQYPAALSGRTHTLGRVFDVFGGALGRGAPEFMNAAGFSSSPHLMFSGTDKNGEYYQLFQIGFGGVPGRPIGDGIDGHSLWPEFNNVPNEYLESYYPMIIERYDIVQDSGGPGKHRGGTGIDQVYRFLSEGEISIHDDRWLTYPWGVVGGKPGKRGTKILIKPDGHVIYLPSKCDYVQVEAGDVLHFITWGGGGWGDPLERDPEKVRLDVLRGLVSEQSALDDYGVVVYDNAEKVDRDATEAIRAEMRSKRTGPLPDFDFGPPLDEILAKCKEETGFDAPTKPFAKVTSGAR